MTKYKLEHIRFDGYTPVPNLCSKTLITDYSAFPDLRELPLLGFDGRSTMQAEGRSSDWVLKPIGIVPDSERNNGYKGYLEDRRPNSQGDPYQIASQILKTIASVPLAAAAAKAA